MMAHSCPCNGSIPQRKDTHWSEVSFGEQHSSRPTKAISSTPVSFNTSLKLGGNKSNPSWCTLPSP
ncbi:hypothetical protein O9929_12635 [Vibrio lentus]|nr:hypothetical protein [Vibrio lentus]